jgi:predicted secreted protein
MTIALAIALYAICWWVVLFAILPIGVRAQHEDGEVPPGTAESAPVAPRILIKMLATTLISGVIFAVLYTIIAYRIITIDDIPFLPQFEDLTVTGH